MRTYALGLAALLGLAIPASADTAASRIQLAQATLDSGARAGSNAGTTEPGSRQSSGKRGGDAMQAPGGSAGTQTSEGRRDGEQSRTGVRANVRVGGDRHMNHSRHDGARTTIRTRMGSNDDTIVRRKSARRHVYSEPSTTFIKRKKARHHYVYSEPSSVTVKRKRVHRTFDDGDTAVVRHRRPGVTVGVGVSGRTGVRERSGESVNVRGSTTTRSSTTTTSGERSSGQTGASVRTNGSGQGAAGGRSSGGSSGGGAMNSRSTSGSGGTGESSGNRQ